MARRCLIRFMMTEISASGFPFRGNVLIIDYIQFVNAELGFGTRYPEYDSEKAGTELKEGKTL